MTFHVLWQRYFSPAGGPMLDPGLAMVLIRVMVGAVFLSEGIQKFLMPAQRGVGRFMEIGLPVPGLLAPVVGGFEIICGLLVLLGVFTRLAVLPLIAIMLVAIGSTKIPILMNKGFWAMAHESRTDFSMLLGSIYLWLMGPGSCSLDALLFNKPSQSKVAGDDHAQ